jgi:YidC/Oxa1 family membrane protein insertase
MDQKNVILAIALSALVIFGWQILQAYLIPPPARPVVQQQPAPTPAQPAQPLPTTGMPEAAGVPGATSTTAARAMVDRPTALARSPRVPIDSPRLKGSIALTGGRIDDVVLADYRETVDPTSPNIVLLSPSGAPLAYFAEFGWVGEGTKLPDDTSLWQADGDKLTPERPLTLTWDNSEGVRFTRVLTLDRNFMLTITQRVENSGAAPLTLYAYGRIRRVGTPQLGISSILHEGPIGVFGRTTESEKYKLHETKYSKIRSEKPEEYDSVGGWLGITDKYWLVAAVPDAKAALHARYSWWLQDQVDVYQIDYVGAAQTIAPGAQAEATGSLFSGAKEVVLLESYAENFAGVEIPLFYRAVDFAGYVGLPLTWIAEPLFKLLHFIYRFVGNFGIAIMVVTVLVKTVFFPLANKSYRAMNRMKKLAPQMQELKQRFGEDRARLNQEMMALYKREKVNPAAGCLPMLVQIPVFIALYQVLYVTIEMRHAPFFGWIKDLSSHDPTSVLNLFGLLPYAVPDLGPLNLLSIGVWPLIMGLTMFLQQKMNPPPPDPVQAKIFMMLPIVFTFMLAPFAAGLVIYWAWNNLLSIAQQWLLKRLDERAAQNPVKPPPARKPGKNA